VLAEEAQNVGNSNMAASGPAFFGEAAAKSEAEADAAAGASATVKKEAIDAAQPAQESKTGFVEVASKVRVKDSSVLAHQTDLQDPQHSWLGTGVPDRPKLFEYALPKRFRRADWLASRDPSIRYSNLMSGQGYPDRASEAARERLSATSGAVAAQLSSMCVQTAPEMFLRPCMFVLKCWPWVVQGLHYNDRPDLICARLGMCDKNSYLGITAGSFSCVSEAVARAWVFVHFCYPFIFFLECCVSKVKPRTRKQQ